MRKLAEHFQCDAVALAGNHRPFNVNAVDIAMRVSASRHREGKPQTLPEMQDPDVQFGEMSREVELVFRLVLPPVRFWPRTCWTARRKAWPGFSNAKARGSPCSSRSRTPGTSRA